MARIVGLIAAIFFVVAAVACDADPSVEPNMDQVDQQFAELMKRPDIDQAVARYQQMYAEVHQQLSTTFPTLGPWQQTLHQGSSACGPDFGAVDSYDSTDPQDQAVEAGMGDWDANGNIPEAAWDQVVAKIGSVIQRYGFDPRPEVVTDRPAQHDANFYDSYGAELGISFGNKELDPRIGGGIGFSFVTGCHLTAEAKKRGHPAARQTY
jgi:hypothetical protein